MRKSILIYSFIGCLFSGVLHTGWGQKLCVEANGTTTEFTLGTIDNLEFNSKGDSLILVCDSIKKNWFLHAIGKIGFEKDSAETYKSIIIELDSGSISYNLEDIVGIAFEPEILDSGDWDGDGLLNDDEIKKYGTDPRSKDTDGDGFDDYEEAHKGSGREWHPLIADLPRIGLEMKGYPDIDFIEERGKTSSRTKTVEKGEEIENSSTQSESHGSSYSQEHGWKYEVTSGISLKPNELGGSVNVTVGAHGSYTQGTTTEYGSSRTSGYEQSFNQALSEMEDSSWNVSGGVIAVPFAVKNTGSIGYTVENLIISCYTIDYSSREGFVGTGCALYPDTRFATFQPFTLAPGDRKEPQWFLNDNLTLELTKELTCQGDALVCEITGSLLSYTDEEGKKTDFTSAMTNVPARTADILVDFGPGKGKNPLRYRVATLCKYNPQHTSLKDIYYPTTLQDILQTLDLEYEMGTTNGKSGIVSLDEVEQETDRNGCWFIAHRKRDENTYAFYSMQQDGYKPEEINIGVNDRVEIIYSIDQDDDGISLRTEKLIGTDDTKTDSDNDSLTDFEEIMGWVRDGDTLTSDPTRVDTDGDGINDPDDPDPWQRKMDSSAEVVKIVIKGVDDGSEFTFDESIGDTITVHQPVMSTTALFIVETAQRVKVAAINEKALQYAKGQDRTCSLLVALDEPSNKLLLRIVSEDESDSLLCNICVLSPPFAPDENSASLQPASPKYNTINISGITKTDTRADGLAILIGFDSTQLADFTVDTAHSLAGLADGIQIYKVDSCSGVSSFDVSGLNFCATHYFKIFTYWLDDNGLYYFSSGTVIYKCRTEGKAIVTVEFDSVYLVQIGRRDNSNHTDDWEDDESLEMCAELKVRLPDKNQTIAEFDMAGTPCYEDDHIPMKEGSVWEVKSKKTTSFDLTPSENSNFDIMIRLWDIDNPEQTNTSEASCNDFYCLDRSDIWRFNFYVATAESFVIFDPDNWPNPIGKDEISSYSTLYPSSETRIAMDPQFNIFGPENTRTALNGTLFFRRERQLSNEQNWVYQSWDKSIVKVVLRIDYTIDE